MEATAKPAERIAAAAAALDSGAVLVDRSSLGMLKFTGSTRLDLINRMSTQAVNDLQRGEGAATVLTTDIGRFIDRLLLYTSSDAVYAVTGANNNVNIGRYLLRFVFWNDDFKIDDLTADTAIFAVYGCEAARLLRKAGFPEVELPLHHWRQAELNGITLYLHATDPIGGAGYFVICQESDREAVRALLVAAGITPVDDRAFEYLRIEAGMPLLGREMTVDYIPLETGLWDDVSFNKGCYTGQEIIARMESRGRLAKKLFRLRAASDIERGAEILSDGRRAGTVTSVASGPAGIVALGYIRTASLTDTAAFSVDGTPVTIVE